MHVRVQMKKKKRDKPELLIILLCKKTSVDIYISNKPVYLPVLKGSPAPIHSPPIFNEDLPKKQDDNEGGFSCNCSQYIDISFFS